MQPKVIKVDKTLPVEVQNIQIAMNKVYRKLAKPEITGEERQLLSDELRDLQKQFKEATKKETKVVPVYNNSYVADHVKSSNKRMYNNRFFL